jgi:glycerol-3-phosphate dehydrogenase
LATADDIAYLLRALNAWIDRPVSEADVVATYAGLRPLVKAAAGRTADLSRRHAVAISPSGVVTVSGGKLTTWRRMAEDTVEALRRVLPPGSTGRSISDRVPIDGAAGWQEAEAAAVAAGVTADQARHLVRRYGGHAVAVAKLARSGSRLGGPLVPGLPYLRAEVVWAARHEMAGSVDDVLSRRTRIALEDTARGGEAAADVASLLASELRFDGAWEEAEVADYGRRVEWRRRSEGLAAGPNG